MWIDIDDTDNYIGDIIITQKNFVVVVVEMWIDIDDTDNYIGDIIITCTEELCCSSSRDVDRYR